MAKLFGTDGIRGVANVHLTPELALKIGRAAALVLTKEGNDKRPQVLIGRDTRASGQMLEGALIAGLNSAGVDVLLAGVIPTPGVAYLTRKLQLLAEWSSPPPITRLKTTASNSLMAKAQTAR